MSSTRIVHNYASVQQQEDEGVEVENISIQKSYGNSTEIELITASNVEIDIEQSFSDAEEDEDEDEDDPTKGGEGKGMRLNCIEACKLTKHYKSWILTLLIWAWIMTQISCIIINLQTNISCISIAIICPDNNWKFNNRLEAILSIIILTIVLLLYILETCCSSSFRYIFSTVNNNSCEQYINNLKLIDMEIWWNIECFHMVRHRRSNGRGGSTTTTSKVVTHRARHKFDYINCRDKTLFNMKHITDNINKYGIGKIKFDVIKKFANKQTEDEYMRQRNEFIAQNRRDKYQSVWTIEYPRDRGIQSFAVENKDWVKSNASKYLSGCYYILVAILLCLPCYKWWMTTIIGDNKYKTYTYTFIKELNIFVEKDPLINGIFTTIFNDTIILPDDVCGLIKRHCGDVHKAPETGTIRGNLYNYGCTIL